MDDSPALLLLLKSGSLGLAAVGDEPGVVGVRVIVREAVDVRSVSFPGGEISARGAFIMPVRRGHACGWRRRLGSTRPVRAP